MIHSPKPVHCLVLARDPRTWVAAAILVAGLWAGLRASLATEFSYRDGQALGTPVYGVDVGPATWDGWFAPRNGVSQPLTAALATAEAWLRSDWARSGHITNLALHIANTVLVYILALVLLRATGRLDSPTQTTAAQHLAALLAALLFGLHPLRVEAVIWVAWRAVPLSVLFLLLGVIFYVRGHARSDSLGGLPASLICFALSLAAGPFGVALPLLLLLLDWCPLRGLRRGATLGRICLEKVPFVVLAGAAIALWTVGRGSSAAGSEASIGQRLAQSGLGPALYVWKTVWPVGLRPLYELHAPLEWLSLRIVGPIAATLVVLALVLGYARRLPAVTVAAISYLLAILPAVWLIQRDFEAAGDRYAYLAAIPLALLMGSGMWWLLSRRDVAVRCIGVAACVLGLAAAALLGFLSWRQCQIWRTPETLWTNVNENGPPAGIARYRLGLLCAEEGQIERAAQLYSGAIAARPGLVDAGLALGDALLRMTRVEQAIEAYRRALRMDQARADTHNRLGNALAAWEEFGPAEKHLRRAVALAPSDPAPRASLGHLLMILRRWDEAVEVFGEALRLAPRDADLCCDLGRARQHAGQTELARESFERALQLDPGHELAKLALSELAQEHHSDGHK